MAGKDDVDSQVKDDLMRESERRRRAGVVTQNDRASLRSSLITMGVAPHLIGGLERYYCDHIRPGSWLYAVLSNDLVGSSVGDPESMASLPAIQRFLLWLAPANAQGSRTRVENWLAMQPRRLLPNDSEAP